MIVLHATIAIAAVVGLIIILKIDPVISLVVGSLYLGLASGLGLESTITAIIDGFGSIMAEVGLLIGFGVLIGALLYSMGALQRLVVLLIRALGPRRLPYAMAAALTTVFPSIYVDVQLVLAAPLARSAAPELGRNGLGLLAGALTAGILVGYVFVVPGLGTVSIAGLLDIPLATMLGYGLVIGTLTVLITVLLYSVLVRFGFWNPDKDEHASEALLEEEALAADMTDADEESGRRLPPLFLALLPVIVPLVMIAFGAIADAAGFSTSLIAFIGNPVFALFVGLLGAYVLAKVSLDRDRTDEAMTKGFNTMGQILLITGVGGSLGEVISSTDLQDVLGDLFSAEAGAPIIVSILLAWLIAAVLHLAIGSISVAAITASGIIGPVLGQLGAPVVIIGLAIGAGALFALQVNSNFFWMFQTLLGVTTRGALKALTFVTALASVVALPLIAGLSLVI
ncbi:GntP family permease [Mycolicibacterium litorale]|uniref:Gluconate permease n=1 Tax=Mycolicibacterium litorale TaxID=758802 RepID=A0A4R8J4R7_9MYCO|nr:GntP family permease [Mycolicibacterium litorale]MCV7415295.1 GntP family permease [Mycolicibacterium litorale]TDY08549.1 H+/gluconate symporter-like permease [Mycolicibacterium litorale]BBY16475.1 gluconate permease [Mycolicibacterium litorale]BCI52852.1 gluconate permease [Mycolicibacterium litorale]